MKVSEVVPDTSAQSYHTPHPGMPMLWMTLIPTWAMNTKKKIMKLKELSLLWRIQKKKRLLSSYICEAKFSAIYCMSTCCIIYCFKQRQFPLLDINISLGSPVSNYMLLPCSCAWDNIFMSAEHMKIALPFSERLENVLSVLLSLKGHLSLLLLSTLQKWRTN